MLRMLSHVYVHVHVSALLTLLVTSHRGQVQVSTLAFSFNTLKYSFIIIFYYRPRGSILTASSPAFYSKAFVICHIYNNIAYVFN